MIEVKNLEKEFTQNGKTFKVLDGINTRFEKGERVAILGPSGSGKSTFLRCLNLLEKPTNGNIIFQGKDITSSSCDINFIRREIGMVFQHFNLFGHLTVIKNIILAPVTLKIMSENQAIEKARTLLKKVGLIDKENVYPAYLSGGQKQRVAIVRALIMNPKVMLFDEPTSALDPEMVHEVANVMEKIANDGMTMIFVSHEIKFVKNLATRFLFMDNGNIMFEGNPKQAFESCENERVSKFLKSIF